MTKGLHLCEDPGLMTAPDAMVKNENQHDNA
jgi:hypothetical protein